jgi:hypothetical protein
MMNGGGGGGGRDSSSGGEGGDSARGLGGGGGRDGGEGGTGGWGGWKGGGKEGVMSDRDLLTSTLSDCEHEDTTYDNTYDNTEGNSLRVFYFSSFFCMCWVYHTSFVCVLMIFLCGVHILYIYMFIYISCIYIKTRTHLRTCLITDYQAPGLVSSLEL